MSKMKRDGLKLLLLLILGIAFGFGMAILIDFVDIGALNFNFNFIFEYALVIQIILIVLLYFPAVIMIQTGKKQWDQANQTIDLEDDIHEKKADKLLFLALVFTRIYFVLSFILFGLSSDVTNDSMIIYSILFIVFILLAGLNEVMIVRIVQKQDPTKKGDPTSLKFQKDYFESLDEAEKVKVYQASHHTFLFMEVALIVLMVLSLMLKLTFDLGNGPIIMIGLTWLIQSGAYFYNVKKFG